MLAYMYTYLNLLQSQKKVDLLNFENFISNEGAVFAVSQKEPRVKTCIEKMLNLKLQLEALELVLTPYNITE